MHRWLFEVEGGHGLTLWTHRRIEDTRPSIVDPVSVLDAAHGSHRVTQNLWVTQKKKIVESPLGSETKDRRVTVTGRRKEMKKVIFV